MIDDPAAQGPAPSIAIVGVACRFPDADDALTLLDMTLAGRRAFRRLPPARLDHAERREAGPADPGLAVPPRAALIEGWQFDAAVRRRYVPRGGHRTTRDLGRTHADRRHSPKPGQRPERGAFRRAAGGSRTENRLRDRRYCGPPANQGKPDGGAAEDEPHRQEGDPRRAARGPAGARRHHGPERAGAGA